MVTSTVRLEDDFARRLKSRLAADGITLQAKVQSLLEEYLDGPQPTNRAAFERQMEIGREVMRRYAPALRELAK